MLKRAPGAADPKNLKAADAQAYVATNCVGEPIPLHLVAADGLTMASVNTVAPDAAGTDVNAPGAIDNIAIDGNGNKVTDPQYPGLKGVWKDTLLVKNVPLDAKGAKAGQYTVIVRTRYERYIGDFVLHCHILDHEDQGMMAKIRVI